MKEYAKRFYKSKAWQQCRESYARSVGNLCEECLKSGIIKEGRIVHHITHIVPNNINDPSVTLNYSNLKLLCFDCHSKEHERETKKRYKVDKYGRVTART